MSEIEELERLIKADPENRTLAMRLVKAHERLGANDEELGRVITRLGLCPNKWRLHSILRGKSVEFKFDRPRGNFQDPVLHCLMPDTFNVLETVTLQEAHRRSALPYCLIAYSFCLERGLADWPPPPKEVTALFRIHHTMKAKNRQAFKKA